MAVSRLRERVAPTPEQVAAAQVERAQQLKDHLFLLATKAEREEVQLAATNAWLDRHEGKPIARVAAEPGTHAGFVIYGEREAESVEAWQAAYPPPA